MITLQESRCRRGVSVQQGLAGQGQVKPLHPPAPRQPLADPQQHLTASLSGAGDLKQNIGMAHLCGEATKRLFLGVQSGGVSLDREVV